MHRFHCRDFGRENLMRKTCERELNAFQIRCSCSHISHTRKMPYNKRYLHIFTRYTTISSTFEEQINLTFCAAPEQEHRGPARICWETQQTAADFQRLPIPHTNAGGRYQPPWCTPGLVERPWLSWETPPRSKCNAETNFCPLPSVTGDHSSCFLDEAENESLFQVVTAYLGTVGLFLSGPADLYWSNSDGVRLDFWDGFWFSILYLHEKFFSLRKILFVKFSKSSQARDALLQLLPGKKKIKKMSWPWTDWTDLNMPV